MFETSFHISPFIATANTPSHPLRQHLDRLPTASTDLFSVILEEGKV